MKKTNEALGKVFISESKESGGMHITRYKEKGRAITFGEIIARERKKRGLSFSELSDLIGFDEDGNRLASSSYLSRLERNKYSSPGCDYILIITAAMNLNLNEVMRSFGFQDKSKDNTSFESFDETIRAAKIDAPLILEDGKVKESALLNIEEKEILISIINRVFDIETNSILGNIANIAGNLEEYRNIRLEKITKFQEKTKKGEI